MYAAMRGELFWPQGIDPADPIYGVYDISAHSPRESREAADRFLARQVEIIKAQPSPQAIERALENLAAFGLDAASYADLARALPDSRWKKAAIAAMEVKQ